MVQVAKAIRLGKAKTIIVTPNIEKVEAEGGLDDLLTSILEQAQQTHCPIVFALSRKKLGQVSFALLLGLPTAAGLSSSRLLPSQMRIMLKH